MKLAIMQPYLFPYIGYWQLINAVDTFVIYDDVNFIKKGYINRNTVLVNGQPHKFTLELKKVSQNKLINTIEIGTNRDKLLKTIYVAYKKAPCFDNVYPVLEDILTIEESNLAKFLGYSLDKIVKYLKINVDFIYSSVIDKDNSLKAQGKIIDINQRLGAATYINPIGGQELYDKIKFQQEDIELKFIKTESMIYQQFDNDFIPNLSIIDVMMFNSSDEIKIMLNRYKLI